LEELLEKGWKLPIYGVAVDEFSNFMALALYRKRRRREIPLHRRASGNRRNSRAPFCVVHLDGTPGHVAGIVIETPPRPAN
jgi:hypothetical protein